MKHTEFSFAVDGVRCAAWLYRPDGKPPFPAVAMAHGFCGTRHLRLDAYAERFARAGCVALVFDYRGFGDSEGAPRQVLDINRQLDDWRAAVREARAMPEVDPARVALWGSSFSGGHVLAIAAEDERVAAGVSQVPFVDGLAVARQTPLKDSLRFAAAAVQDLARAALGREPFTIPAVGLPGDFAAMTTPDAELMRAQMVPPGVEWVNAVAARIFLSLPLYRPGRRTGRIRCPILFAIAEKDVLTPIAPVLAAAKRAKQAEVRRYPIGHFDIYLGAWFERAAADQVEFLRRCLFR